MKNSFIGLIFWTLGGFQLLCAQGLRHGLEAYYNFLGNCDDISVYAVNGLGINASYGEDRWSSPNSALYCQPIDTHQYIYAQMPDTPIHRVQNQITLCAWVRYDDVGRSTIYPMVMSKCYSQSSNMEHSYFMGIDNVSKKWQMGFGTDSGMYVLKSQDTATIGRWVHLAVLFNNGEVRNYIDGRLQDSLQALGSLHYSNIGLRIGTGRINVFDNQWIGAIDDVLIYDHILSQSQIQAWANTHPTAITPLESTVTPSEIMVYPNPANTILNIDSKLLWEQARVVDRWGRVVLRLENVNGQLALDNLDNGVYFLQLQHRQQWTGASFVIQR